MKLLESLPPRLNMEEETALALKIRARKANEDLLNDLVLSNMHEAFLYMKGFCKGRIEDDEIFSLCYKTLLRNAKRFEVRSGGLRFLAFAKAGLRGAVCRYWTTVDAVKNSTGMISIDARVSDEDSDRSQTETQPLLETSSEDFPFPLFDIKEKYALVKGVMAERLTQQEQMVMALVYENNFNFQEVGTLLGVTRSAAQAHHSKALKKIRQELEKRGLLKV